MPSNEQKVRPTSLDRTTLTYGNVLAKIATFPLSKMALHYGSRIFDGQMSRLDEGTSLIESLPNFDSVFKLANFRHALLALHIGASAIHFEDQSKTPHPNNFVRRVAKLDNLLHNTPQHKLAFVNTLHVGAQKVINGTAPVAVHSAPELIPSTIPAVTNLKEHPIASSALIFMGAMSVLHTVNSVAKVAAKLIEKYEETNPEVRRAKKAQRALQKATLVTSKKTLKPGTTLRVKIKEFQDKGRRAGVEKIEKNIQILTDERDEMNIPQPRVEPEKQR